MKFAVATLLTRPEGSTARTENEFSPSLNVKFPGVHVPPTPALTPHWKCAVGSVEENEIGIVRFATRAAIDTSETLGFATSLKCATGARSSSENAPEWTAHSTPNVVLRVVSQPVQPAKSQLLAG